MRIAIVYFAEFPPKVGATGGDRRVRDIAIGLAAQPGVEVTMLAARREPRQDRVSLGAFDAVFLGGTSRSVFGRIASRLSYWRDFLRLNKQARFDWIIFYSVNLDALLPAILAAGSGTKVAAEFCDLVSVGHMAFTVRTWLSSRWHALGERLLPKVTSLNIVISRGFVTHVRRQAPATPVVKVPVLVDGTIFKPVENPRARAKTQFTIPEEATLIAYVGGLWKQEGVAYLVEAFSSLAGEFPHLKLIIAGSLVSGNGDFDDVEALVDKLGIRDRVVLPGWVSTEDVALIYSRADILVLPQVDNTFAQMAMPTKLAEYSAMARPIVATRVGDVPLYFTHEKDALLVESCNVEQLAQSIRSLASDPQLRERLGAGAKSVAREHFDPVAAGKRIVSAMKDVSQSNQDRKHREQATGVTPTIRTDFPLR